VLSLQKIKLIIMPKENISKQNEASANDSSAMETGNHSKNGSASVYYYHYLRTIF
jgi:hypothetical protein